MLLRPYSFRFFLALISASSLCALQVQARLGELILTKQPKAFSTSTDTSKSRSQAILIRCPALTNANHLPLYVVDGNPDWEQGYRLINSTAIIKKVKIIQPQKAARLYGSRAAYGVIVITTKGNKKGRLN